MHFSGTGMTTAWNIPHGQGLSERRGGGTFYVKFPLPTIGIGKAAPISFKAWPTLLIERPSSKCYRLYDTGRFPLGSGAGADQASLGSRRVAQRSSSTRGDRAMPRILALAIACIMGLTTGAEASRRKRAAPEPQRTPLAQPAQVQDEYKSCDVHVRDFVQGRVNATALPVKEVKVDGLRMRLNFVHPYGESGDTPPNLSFTRGETIDERRKALNETKQRINALAEAAKAGSVWYVIALRNNYPDASNIGRSLSNVQGDESHSLASAAVFASLDNKCITVSEFPNLTPDRVSVELRKLLGEKDREASSSEPSVTGSIRTSP
jgi:hypothetical protein